jgi:uncharacterized phage-associated protein
MPYKSTILAKYIAAYFNEKAVDINITKIQKLTYIAYGVYLAVKGERLVDEHPQAWPFGPVFPATRNKLVKMNLYDISMQDKDLQEIKEDREVKSLIKLVYNTFGEWSASQLTAWSHKDGSPWEMTVSKEGFKWGGRIDDGDIKSYFNRIVYDVASEAEKRG